MRDLLARKACVRVKSAAARAQMEPIDEELDESITLAAGRVPSSLSQMSHLQSFVRRSSFEGRRCARLPALCTRAVHQMLALGYISNRLYMHVQSMSGWEK